MAEDNQLITLKIFSPSTEVNGPIVFTQISVTTTVKELKLRIQNEISTKPTVERMRLIYRGRVVANEEDSLVNIFGLEDIRNSTEHSLHLVLRELPTASSSAPASRAATSPAPRSSTAPPPNPFRPTPTPTTQQTNPFRSPPIPELRPNSQPQVPPPHHHHHLHHHHPPHPPHPNHHGPQLHSPNPFVQMPIPPEILQQHIAQAMAQSRAQLEQQHQAHIHSQNAQRSHTPDGAQRNAESSSSLNQPQLDGNAPPGIGNRVPTPSNLGMHNLQPNSTRTIRHEAIGPNGQRWTMTINNTNVTIPGQPNPMPPLGSQQRPISLQPTPVRSPVNPPERELLRIRNGLQGAERELENVYILMRTSGPNSATPFWRDDQIRHHLSNLMQNLDQLQNGLAPLIADPNLSRNGDVLSLQIVHNSLRSQATNLQEILNHTAAANQPTSTSSDSSSANQTPSASSAQPTRTENSESRSIQSSSRAALAQSGPELFVLSSPQGPVGILFDERGTYSTAPFAPLLSFQDFNQRFAANRQILSTLGHHIAHNSVQTPDNLAAAQPQPAPVANQQAQPQAPGAAADGGQAQNQNPEERLQVNLGLLWFLLKLGVFIYIFAGNGGWYRPIMMCIAGFFIYLAQTGMFENHFDRIRHHFEALLPIADRPRVPNPNAQPGPGEGTENPGEINRPEAARNLSPEETAQRLVRNHQQRRLSWVRERTRTIERSLAIFVASLWPGLGERMVQAQEERERAERAAEEERRRQEEEQAAREQQGEDFVEEQRAQGVVDLPEVTAHG